MCRDGFRSFLLSRFFGTFSVVSSGGRCCLDDVDQSCELVLELQCLTVTYVSAHGPVHVDTQVAVAVSFSFQFCMVFRAPRNMKPVKLKPQVFSLFVETFVT